MAAPNTPIDSAELASFLRARLAKHMVPKSIHLVDALPLTASGKVSKAELRRLLEGLPTQVP